MSVFDWAAKGNFTQGNEGADLERAKDAIRQQHLQNIKAGRSLIDSLRILAQQHGKAAVLAVWPDVARDLEDM